jgi:outer membrane assembly lipoprotein YfiO
VLYRLLIVNDKKAYTGLLFREREVDRDMEPNKQIITEYKRFYLLYPQTMYAQEVTPIFRVARRSLAEHEIRVADFYFGREQYNAAAGRYLFALRNFPELEKEEYALRRLIESYRRDQQLDLANEMQRAYEQQYGKRDAAAQPVPVPAVPQAGTPSTPDPLVLEPVGR